MSEHKWPPDEWVEDGWNKFDEGAKKWYIRFVKATKYSNMSILQELCDEAPTDQFERLRSEIWYERDEHKRAQYTLPKSRFPSYTEWDYSWSAPRHASAKDSVIAEYYGEQSDSEDYDNPITKRRARRV